MGNFEAGNEVAGKMEGKGPPFSDGCIGVEDRIAKGAIDVDGPRRILPRIKIGLNEDRSKIGLVVLGREIDLPANEGLEEFHLVGGLVGAAIA